MRGSQARGRYSHGLFQRLIGNANLQKITSAIKQEGSPLAITDDVKIIAPRAVIKELTESFPTIAWEESSLTTKTVENRIFVRQQSART
jgi:hypothetical protein